MDGSFASKASQQLDAVSQPNRLRILDILAAGECCVRDLQGRLGIRQQAATFHLRVLRLRGLVQGRRAGKCVLYGITDDGRRLLAGAMAAVV